jgi:hypothetical protein
MWGPRPDFYYCELRVCSCGAPSLTRGRVCRLQLLLTLTSAVIFTAVKISSTCHQYLQFYMSEFYIVSCQRVRFLVDIYEYLQFYT